jgi:AmmeMemoRadiSam system protein B/AmmeMemoRadiSam system protein A
MKVRPAAVAGTFYTRDPSELRRQVEGFVRAAPSGGIAPKALISPHAGYVYSGPVAGHAFAALAPLRDVVQRVVLLGPAHRVYTAGLAASSADAFDTPLGRVPLDRAAIAGLLERFSFVRLHDAAHGPEHSLEVQLPFLQAVLGDFQLVPLVAGDADPREVEAVIEHLWGGEETLIVVSSDLSHYLDYATATRLDQETVRHILAFEHQALGSERACGLLPILGLLNSAARHRLHPRLLDYRNSGDTAGPKDQVVGYAAIGFFEESDPAALGDEERRRLTEVARDSVSHALRHGTPLIPALAGFPERLRAMRATFVTLKSRGELRGCVGTLSARRPLAEDVAHNAYAAAFQDPRFPPLAAAEFEELSFGISVLSPAVPIGFGSEAELLSSLRPGVDGIILRAGSRTGTFLPAVWESLPQPRDFIAQLKRKAGLPADYWSPAITVERYTTESW